MSQVYVLNNRVFPPFTVVQFLTGNNGLPVGPDAANNINILGSGSVTVTGNPATHTLTISIGGTIPESFPTDSGTATPAAGILNVFGGNSIGTTGSGNTIHINVTGTTNHSLLLGNILGSISSLGVATNGQLPIGSTGTNPVLATLTAGTGISITNGAGSISIATSGGVGESFPTDSGTATPAAGVLNVFGGTAARDINTSGSGNTIHIDLNNAITLGDLASITGSNALTLTTGDATLTTGSIKLSNSTSNLLTGYIEYAGISFIHNFGDRCAWIGSDIANPTASIAANDNNGHGYQVLRALTTGTKNNAIGNQSGLAGTTLTNNNFFGYQVAKNLVSGDSNLILGHQSGDNYTTNESSNILMHNLGVLGESNTLRIGFATGTGTQQLAKAFICGIDGVNVGSVAKVVTMASDQLGTATITAGTGITVTPGANTITIAATGTTTLTYTLVNTTPYVVAAGDDFLGVDCSGGAIQINLPNAPATGRVFIVKDSTGSAATHNITVTTVGGVVNIDGATTFVMNTNFQSVQVLFDGSTYQIF
jgi:hypothetical protein